MQQPLLPITLSLSHLDQPRPPPFPLLPQRQRQGRRPRCLLRPLLLLPRSLRCAEDYASCLLPAEALGLHLRPHQHCAVPLPVPKSRQLCTRILKVSHLAAHKHVMMTDLKHASLFSTVPPTTASATRLTARPTLATRRSATASTPGAHTTWTFQTAGVKK
jgi:hypothetical protein